MQSVGQIPQQAISHKPPIHAKIMAISGAAAIVASIVASIAIIVFAAAIMPIVLPITATFAAAGIICLSIGLATLKMKPNNKSLPPPTEAKPLTHFVEIKDLAQNDRPDEALKKFEQFTPKVQKEVFEDMAQFYLKDENKAVEWILRQKGELLTSEQRLELFRKLIEHNKHHIKFDLYERIGHMLELELEKVTPLLTPLCKTYIEHKKFDEAYQPAVHLHLVESLPVIFEEFVKLKKCEELEWMCLNITDDQPLKNGWLCKLAEVYANMGKMEEAIAKLAGLSEMAQDHPERRLFELLKIRLYAHLEGDKAIKALDDALISISGGLGTMDLPNYSAVTFTTQTIKNIPESFKEACKQQDWNSAHQILVDHFQAFKNPPPPENQSVPPLQNADDSFDDW